MLLVREMIHVHLSRAVNFLHDLQIRYKPNTKLNG